MRRTSRNSWRPLLKFALLFVGLNSGLSMPAQNEKIEPRVFRNDDASLRAQTGLVKGSHVKVFIPSLPYLYTSHAINAALIRPSDNPQGWEYDMATWHRQIDDRTYEFTLRKGVRFQDGTPFNAAAVVMNMEYFKKKPFLYSKIDKVFDRCEKVDDDTVRFYLKEKYGCFFPNDVVWMQFYTEAYLKKWGWNGKGTCPNLAEPGPYGLGPYILKEGYIEGDRHTPQAVLVANTNYYDPNYPKVETITVYTELKAEEAKKMALYNEGELDIAVLSPQDKVETVLAPYSKLVISSSTDNIAIHMNLCHKGNPKLQDVKVRKALNEALNQPNLLHFALEDEGDLSPISPLFPGVEEVAKELATSEANRKPYDAQTQQRLKQVLDGLTLKVLTQDHFMPLWRGIQTQLKRVGVELQIEVVKSENDIFGPLLKTNKGENDKAWDLLIWGNDDWFFNHPWTAFFVYRTNNMWSTVSPDETMNGYIDVMFQESAGTQQFSEICRTIMRRAIEHGYMLYVPTPNKVFAVNKEVVFHPYKMACMPLWKIQVTDLHWSIREGPYPESLKQPVKVTRIKIRAGAK